MAAKSPQLFAITWLIQFPNSDLPSLRPVSIVSRPRTFLHSTGLYLVLIVPCAGSPTTTTKHRNASPDSVCQRRYLPLPLSQSAKNVALWRRDRTLLKFDDRKRSLSRINRRKSIVASANVSYYAPRFLLAPRNCQNVRMRERENETTECR